MAVTVQITDTDKGMQRIRNEMAKLQGAHALVGIQSTEGSELVEGTNITLAGLAVVHEFGAEINHPGGTPFIVSRGGLAEGGAIFLKKGDPRATGVTKPHLIRIPERSFVRATIDKRRERITKFAANRLGLVQEGKLSARQAVGQLGEFVVGEMKDFMGDRSNFEPNAPSTVKAKSRAGKVGDAPLIDTGNLIGSIRSKPVMVKAGGPE